jgi:cytochrome c oxidase subunit 2
MRSRHRRAGSRLTVLAGLVAVGTAGCSAEQVGRGWMPGDPGITSHTDRITHLWTGSWIAALVVGALVWGLMIWCMTAYRRRKDDPEFPDQLRYHVPLEILYTVVPLIAVSVLFFFTARDQAVIESREAPPDTTIGVIGKQWSWDFNYVNEDVFSAGIQTPLGTPDAEKVIPTLYLPVDQTVRLEIHARDVIHSVWVPDFLYKKDAIPGRTNLYQFVPEKVGTYAGRCAELCGEFHSEMLFAVKVVEQAEYDQYIQGLRDAGQTGQLPVNLGRVDTDEGEQTEDLIGENTGGQEDEGGNG